MRVSRWCHFAHRHRVCCQKSGSHDVGLDLLSCPCYGKCATHVGAVQQKEVRRRSRERANSIERASEIW